MELFSPPLPGGIFILVALMKLEDTSLSFPTLTQWRDLGPLVYGIHWGNLGPLVYSFLLLHVSFVLEYGTVVCGVYNLHNVKYNFFFFNAKYNILFIC